MISIDRNNFYLIYTDIYAGFKAVFIPFAKPLINLLKEEDCMVTGIDTSTPVFTFTRETSPVPTAKLPCSHLDHLSSNEAVTMGVMGDIEQYRMCWTSSAGVNCVRLVKCVKGFYIIPFGCDPEGHDYEDSPYGPYATLDEAKKEAEYYLTSVA